MTGRRRGQRMTVGAGVLVMLGAIGLMVPTALSLGPFGKPMTVALHLTYDGDDPEFLGVYATGDPFMDPSIRVEPLRSAKAAAAYGVTAIEASGYDDYVGAVGFAEEAVWMEPLTPDHDLVRARLRGATASDDSNLDAGMRAALDELLSVRARRHANKTMLLVTDGLTNENDALAMAHEVAGEGVTIHVVGVGCGVNRDLLRRIAAIGGGVASFVDVGRGGARIARRLRAVMRAIMVEQVNTGLIQ